MIDTCLCGGQVVALRIRAEITGEVEDTGEALCRRCGGVYTKSGKFLPPNSGWALPYVPVQAIVWANGGVMVFDALGQQISHLQFALGRGTDRERELERLMERERWEWRFFPGNEPGIATPEWLAGRAAWINRHFGLPEDDLTGGNIAEIENQDAALIIGANVVWKMGGAQRYGLPGNAPDVPDGARPDPGGQDSPGKARNPVRDK